MEPTASEQTKSTTSQSHFKTYNANTTKDIVESMKTIDNFVAEVAPAQLSSKLWTLKCRDEQTK
ncbi:MAG: hypothetical protein ACTS6A_01745 [Candidatus Hodgkinia cicadicola]